MQKNILLIASTSDIGKSVKKLFEKKGYNLYCTSRDKNNTYYLDVTDSASFSELYNKIKEVEFDAIINCAGIAVSSPVELLKEDELQKQIDVVLYGLLRTLQTFSSLLRKKGRVVNISSMASYGIFPFISPYCISKASSDILLFAFEAETGIKTISVKPGVVATSFWEYCIELNKDNFAAFKGSYEKAGKYLLYNASCNSNKGIKPDDVAKCVLSAVESKFPKSSYNVGIDSHFTSLLRYLPGSVLIPLIRFALNMKMKKVK